MSRVANEVREAGEGVRPSIDVDALKRAAVNSTPFRYLIVPGFVRAEALRLIGQDFPQIGQHGSFPLPSLRYGPAFGAFTRELEGSELRAAVSEKLGIDLSASPSMITVRGMSRAVDGKIHTDSKSKLVTALVYMSDVWESAKGRLRLVRSPNDLNDVVAEVPPDAGTLLLFKNQENAWHGFEPYSGPRRVVQLNWVTSAAVVRRERTRHRISAFFKRLRGA
jgi:SM-20-related protein